MDANSPTKDKDNFKLNNYKEYMTLHQKLGNNIVVERRR